MGGHSIPRTHRPRGRLPGAAFISGLERAVSRFASSGRLKTYKGAELKGLKYLPDDTSLKDRWRLSVLKLESGLVMEIEARSVILATGGYSADAGL